MGNKADYIRMDRPESALAGPRRANEHTKKIVTFFEHYHLFSSFVT